MRIEIRIFDKRFDPQKSMMVESTDEKDVAATVSTAVEAFDVCKCCGHKTTRDPRPGTGKMSEALRAAMNVLWPGSVGGV